MNYLNKLTEREKEVLDLLSAGFSTREIAGQLFLSFDTIKTHRRNLIIKLGARNVANLIRIAFEMQMIPPRRVA